jgi:hypothetical protein
MVLAKIFFEYHSSISLSFGIYVIAMILELFK